MTAPETPAARTASRMITELALQQHAAQADGHSRHPGLFELPEQPPALAAVRAARLLRRELQKQLRCQALRARGDGEGWAEIAVALELNDDGRPDASAAFLTVLGPRNDDPWWTQVSGVRWTCTSCEEVVRDFGPEVGGPDDRETGHASTCARHTGEIVAWDALWS